ncbi:MAG: hypothetical protein HYV26_10380 [Candidatus Hydrogenedentes bacterium]|nr:hypothetical protein [Candidatus Hydrogenedentota bacterium]
MPLRLLFWGLVFSILDFRVNGVDVLADIIGYGLFFLAIPALLTESHAFRVFCRYAVFCALLSIASFWNAEELFRAVLTLGTQCCKMGMLWFACGGVAEIARRNARIDLSDTALRRRRHCLIAWLIATTALVLGMAGVLPPELVIPFIVAALVTVIAALVLVYRVPDALAHFPDPKVHSPLPY